MNELSFGPIEYLGEDNHEVQGCIVASSNHSHVVYILNTNNGYEEIYDTLEGLMRCLNEGNNSQRIMSFRTGDTQIINYLQNYNG